MLHRTTSTAGHGPRSALVTDDGRRAGMITLSGDWSAKWAQRAPDGGRALPISFSSFAPRQAGRAGQKAAAQGGVPAHPRSSMADRPGGTGPSMS